MPWTCKVCHTVYTADNNDYGLACFKTKECKAKGLFACAWTAPPQQAAVLTEAQEAAALGYPNLHNSFQDKFPKKHNEQHVCECEFVAGDFVRWEYALGRAVGVEGVQWERAGVELCGELPDEFGFLAAPAERCAGGVSAGRCLRGRRTGNGESECRSFDCADHLVP